MLKIFGRNIRGNSNSPFYQRLESEIFLTEQSIKRRIEVKKDSPNDSKWDNFALNQIERAKMSLKQMNIDDGWKALNAAKRFEVYAMEIPERKAVAIQVDHETEKLNKWRASAIKDIFGHEHKYEEAISNPEVLIKAIEIRDEHFDNRYNISKIAHGYFSLLFALLCISLMAILIWFIVQTNQDLNTLSTGMSMIGIITGVLLFGFLGAISSSILFLRKTFIKAGNQDMRILSMILLSKIIISSAFSLFIFFLVKSSLAQQVDIFSFEVSNIFDYLALAFVSGFSERLAQKAIEKFTGKE
jgi:hypothetical protein